MKKLLDRSFKVFLNYAAIVLICSIPVYYFLVDRIWQHELKEHNRITSAGIKSNLLSMQLSDSALQESMQLWNRLQPEKQIRPASSLKSDSTYNIYRKNRYLPAKHEDRFQGLVTYFELKGKPYSLTVETNMEESYETILGLSIVSLLFFIALLIGLLILNRRLSARIWQPFYQSLKKIQGFDLDKQQPMAFSQTDIVEFEMLNESLDKLISNSTRAYRQQKHFIENASHELQTPLAVVQSKLDLFLQDILLSQHQAGIIEQAQMALARVNRINKNLLLLAKMEHSHFPAIEQVNVSDLLHNTLELLDSFVAEKQLHMVSKIAPEVMLEANKTLLEIMLSNLLMNAIRYSPDNSEIGVELSVQQLQVSNAGTQALNSEHLFQRFGNVSDQAPATGLGLAIVKQIGLQYGWDVTYHFSTAQHHFIVSFS